MAQAYKPVARIPVEQVFDKMSKEMLYWKRMKRLSVFEEPGFVTSLAFSPVDGNVLASTSSVRLTIYDLTICEPFALYSRFKQAVYGAQFRSDGKLLAVGGQEGLVRVVGVQKRSSSVADTPKSALRTFKTHSCAVHVVLFTCCLKNLIAMGDDGTVKVMSIADTNSEFLKVYPKAHSDRIRCGDVSKKAKYLFVSGSYDHVAKVWNMQRDNDEPLTSVVHGAPVEALRILPGDALLVTAGGENIKIWNIAVGGDLLQTLHNHHKTVTSLSLASVGKTLLSGGLDKRVNVYCMDGGEYRLAYSFSFPVKVLAIAASCNDHFMAVGMDNLLEVSNREKLGKLEENIKLAAQNASGLEFRRSLVNNDKSVAFEKEGKCDKKAVQLSAPPAPQLRMGKIDLLLRRFKHWKALDVLFREKYFRSRPEIILATFIQIYKRGVLKTALSGRQADTLCPMLSYIIENIGRSDYFCMLVKVTEILCDIYGDEETDPKVAMMFIKLQREIKHEVELRMRLTEIQGMVQMMLKASEINFTVSSVGKDDNLFGEVVVSPIPFKMDADNDETSDLHVDNNNVGTLISRGLI